MSQHFFISRVNQFLIGLLVITWQIQVWIIHSIDFFVSRIILFQKVVLEQSVHIELGLSTISFRTWTDNIRIQTFHFSAIYVSTLLVIFAFIVQLQQLVLTSLLDRVLQFLWHSITFDLVSQA